MAADVSKISLQNVGWADWSYTGVDFSLAGNGGDDCVNFISIRQRIVESILIGLGSGFILYRAITRITLPESLGQAERLDHCGKRVLLVVMCLTLGIEVGFKCATRQMIYILNPCHLITMLQIYCLAAPPSKFVTAVFRYHIHLLTGAVIAILFPVINTRLLPFETEVYYIQHILMIVIPFYLMRIGGVYTVEPYSDFSWSQVSMTTMYIYHFIPLQYLGVLSKVNLDNMLCPAVSDPFYGPWYRLWAIGHQTILINTLGKCLVWIATQLSLRKICINENEVLVCYGSHCVTKTNDMDSSCKSHNNMAVNGKNGMVLHHSHERKASNGHLKCS